VREVELSGVAVEIRQRRKLLGLSQVQLAEVSHVSRTVINKVEQGARVPSIRTYARLRAPLGLEAPRQHSSPYRSPRAWTAIWSPHSARGS
jgi:transcriptional regulator with XRE-family HTH domain